MAGTLKFDNVEVNDVIRVFSLLSRFTAFAAFPKQEYYHERYYSFKTGTSNEPVRLRGNIPEGHPGERQEIEARDTKREEAITPLIKTKLSSSRRA